MDLIVAIVIAAATLCIGLLVGYTYRKNHTERKIDRTEEYAKRMMCVSLHPTMTSDDNRYICAALITCLKKL